GLYFLIPLIVLTLISAEARRIELRDRARTAFMAVWLLTPLAFYVFIHVGEYGYIFSLLPGLTILAARGAIAFAKGIRMPRTFKWIVAAVVLGNASIYLLSDTPISARDIARHDRGIDEKLAYLATFKPQTTEIVSGYDAVLAEGAGWQEVRMPHGSRLRIAHVPRSGSLRVSEGLGVEIVP